MSELHEPEDTGLTETGAFKGPNPAIKRKQRTEPTQQQVEAIQTTSAIATLEEQILANRDRYNDAECCRIEADLRRAITALRNRSKAELALEAMTLERTKTPYRVKVRPWIGVSDHLYYEAVFTATDCERVVNASADSPADAVLAAAEKLGGTDA